MVLNKENIPLQLDVANESRSIKTTSSLVLRSLAVPILLLLTSCGTPTPIEKSLYSQVLFKMAGGTMQGSGFIVEENSRSKVCTVKHVIDDMNRPGNTVIMQFVSSTNIPGDLARIIRSDSPQVRNFFNEAQPVRGTEKTADPIMCMPLSDEFEGNVDPKHFAEETPQLGEQLVLSSPQGSVFLPGKEIHLNYQGGEQAYFKNNPEMQEKHLDRSRIKGLGYVYGETFNDQTCDGHSGLNLNNQDGEVVGAISGNFEPSSQPEDCGHTVFFTPAFDEGTK